MERIADIFSNNPKVALVAVVSLRDRAVILKETRVSIGAADAGAHLPTDTVVNTYLNIITTAALAFDIESEAQQKNAAESVNNGFSSPQRGGGGGPQVDSAVQDEAWGLMRFRTRQWDICAFRQDNADVVAENENSKVSNYASKNSGGASGGGADQYLMITFSEPKDGLGVDAGNMTARGTRR